MKFIVKLGGAGFGVTVRQALTIGGLTRARPVAGLSGLDRVIKYVDIMEVPDFASWVRPNEFIITCAYAIKDNPNAQVELVHHLARCNAAALAVKPGRFLGSMPEAMVQAAEEESVISEDPGTYCGFWPCSSTFNWKQFVA
ncbi:MAG: PucR family transcriptional regulator ligand-binding domain-containing protein, partial [Bacillota bacterium]